MIQSFHGGPFIMARKEMMTKTEITAMVNLYEVR